MADPNDTSSNKPNQEAPGEVRSNLQVVVRIVLAVVVIAFLIGLGVALVRLLSRPDPLEAATVVHAVTLYLNLS